MGRKNEKNRPDKPGCWWWEDDEGCKHVVEFNDDMKSIFVWWQMSPLEMEELSDFKQWLGPAYYKGDVDDMHKM